MSTILIKSDKETNAILSKLAKKLGSSVVPIDDAQYEDFALGLAMEKSKTGQIVDKSVLSKILKEK